MQDFRKLRVWQKAHRLAVDVNKVTQPVVRRDRSGCVSQARRAALSIPSNIAEGCGRPTNRDFAKFLHIAIGSASELENQVQFARDIDLIPVSQCRALGTQVVAVRRMLYGLLKRVQGDE
jgi:four helix bundle protein